MITAWVILITINCTEPRLSYRDFYERVTSSTFPGVRGERMEAINERLVNVFASFADYSVSYQEKCR